jgi:putative salt-induced outer membrane protein YdiY
LIRFLIPALWLITLTETGLCDIVEVLNGDRVTGTLNNLSSGKLTFDTPYAGQIYIDWKQVRSIETTSKFEVDLMNGQTITGAIATVQPGEYRIGSESGATILASDIAAIRTPPEVNRGLLSGWHATTDLGYTTTRGNSHTNQLALQFQPQRRTERDTIKFDIQALSGIADEGNTKRQSLETRYDRFVSPHLFYFIVGKGERDRLASLQLRLRQGTGLGVRIKFGATTQVSTLTGFSVVEEHFSGQNYKYNPEGLFGYEFETRAIRPFQITSKAQFLPNFVNLGRFRSEWDTAIRVPFARHINAGVRLFHRFDSEPAAGARKADYGLISTIGTTF